VRLFFLQRGLVMANSSYQFRLSHLFVAFVLASFWLVSVRWGNPTVTTLWFTFFLGLLCIGTARAVALTGSRRVFWSVLVLITVGYSGAAIEFDVRGTYEPGQAKLPTTNILLWAKDLAVQQDKQSRVKPVLEHDRSPESGRLEVELDEDPFGPDDDPVTETDEIPFADFAYWPLSSNDIDRRDYKRENEMVEIGQTGIALLLGYVCAIYAVGLYHANAKKSVMPTLEN